MALPDDRDPDDRDPDDVPPDDRAPRSRRRDVWWTGWLAAGTFVLGLVAGVLLLALLGTEPAAPTAREAAAGPGPVGPGTASAEETGRVEVNAACLRAINAAQDIAAAVEDLGTAAAVLDAAQLDEVIRRLQPLQDRLQENTADCEATGTTPSEPAPGSPTATPSG